MSETAADPVRRKRVPTVNAHVRPAQVGQGRRIDVIGRLRRWTPAVLLGASLVGVPVAHAGVGFNRIDVAVPAAPDSVALGDFDGVRGKDIAVALSGRAASA